MSCQSLTPATRAFEPDKENLTFHRSVRFSSESRNSTRKSESEAKRDAHGSLSLSTLSMGHHVTPTTSMSQSAPPPSTIDLDDIPALPTQTCRFPKLEECAHFHYERASLGGIQVETIPCSEDDACSTHCDDNTDNDEGWICLKVRSHIHSPPALIEPAPDRSMNSSWEASDVCEWSLTRNVENLLLLDDNLHSCVYDRKVSRLPKLSEVLTPSMIKSANYHSVIEDYMRRLSRVADDSMICGPVLNWLQMDNKGHKLLVANEDSSSINTPAVAAAYSVRKYVSQARDEISFEVGDMISIIDMPGPQESVWWRGKRGFKVGFFPHHCVAVIGDKVPRHMTQPPPIVGSVAVTTIKPVLRKHGKLISLFRSFILSRPSRRSLKQQGILKERVFGCDLGEHLLNCGYDVPLVLKECAQIIESRGPTDGVYRLSGTANVTQTLRATYDGTCQPNPTLTADTHALASLLKMYFRELPNPLCTYQLYESFVYAVQSGVPDEEKLQRMKDTVAKLPPPHYRTLGYLMRHLRRVSLLGHLTGMTARNMAIVWAPNLLRSPHSQHALTGVAVQAVVTEFLICYAEQLFSEENQPTDQEVVPEVITRHEACGKRPKSLPPNAPARLLSLEEARRRGKSTTTPPLPSIVIPQLSISHPTKYIEVGSGPNNLPQYHTVLPAPNKRGLKRSPSGWKGLFSRSKLRIRPTPPPTPTEVTQEIDVTMVASALRPVKSCESLQSESDTLGPLLDTNSGQLKSHTRSASCDSYFEQWQLELADMRLRLSPQERDHNIFSEEDDTTANIVNGLQGASICSSPVCSESCSAEPSPRKLFTLNEADNERKRSKLTEEMNTIGYIDGESPVRLKPAEKRHSDEWVSHHTNTDIAKRVCKDRDSPKASLAEFPSPLGSVKLRERSSPRKTKNSTIRYSGLHQPLMLTEKPVTNTNCQNQPRMSWHGAKDHSTLIKIDWPIENSVNSLTASTLNSSPITPLTPIYDPLIDSDNELKGCDNCKDDKKCLKCELTECSDYENLTTDFVNHTNEHVTVTDENKLETDISYQNLNRLSAISTNSSASDPNSAKKSDGVYENVVKDIRNSVMTSSHESSSSFSKHSDELFECYGFARPNYINLQSSTSSKSSNSSPLKSPLKSTISITFRSPTKSCKSGDYEALDTPKNERDSVYEDIDLEKNLSIVEEATIPHTDASLPTQDACQPDSIRDLIILETPTEEQKEKQVDIYNQVKFFKQSVEEVNAMVLESPENKGEDDSNAYENIDFVEIKSVKDYENIEVTKNCDSLTVAKDIKPEQKSLIDMDTKSEIELDNGNTIKAVTKNLNVKQLATRFESPTEQKGPFNFKISTLERKKEEIVKKDLSLKLPPPISPKTYKLNKCSISARSLDENAFVKEFGGENVQYIEKININDIKKDNNKTQDLDLNLNLEEVKIDEPITPTSENKLSLIQRFDDNKATESKNLTEADKKLSRERIEKYKEERRNFLREKYSSQSFRSNNPSEHLVRLKVKKNEDGEHNEEDGDSLPKFERRNTVDLGQRMRFSLAKSANNLDTIQSPDEQRDDVKMSNAAESSHKCDSGPRSGDFDRKEKISPSYNIKDMAAMFEQKSQNSNNG